MGIYMGTYMGTYIHTYMGTYIHTVHALSYTCIRFCQLLQCKALSYTCSMRLQSLKLNHECSITSTSLPLSSLPLSSFTLQAGYTKQFLRRLTRGAASLPDGPLFLTPSSLVTAFKKSVYAIHPHPLHNATNLYICMYVCVCVCM